MSSRAHAILLATMGKIKSAPISKSQFEALGGDETWDDFCDSALHPLEGRFLISGYPSELYSSFADHHGWRCEKIEIDNKSSSKKVKDKKTECVWMNY